jgi:hypothetical protein
VKLSILSDETLMDLRTNYDSYKEHYYLRDNTWFNQYFNENGKVIETKIDYEMPVFCTVEDYAVRKEVPGTIQKNGRCLALVFGQIQLLLKLL